MTEELAWGLPVVGYLFLAGLGAGAVSVSSAVLLRGGGGGFGGRHIEIARYGALLGPLPVMIGAFMIVFELGRPFRALNLYKVINLSPMSIGSWVVLLFIILSLVYALVFMPWPVRIWERLRIWRISLAWVCLPLGIAVAVYTGILLGAMPSRPFWNSPILALLFLISALSSGIAAIILTQALLHGNNAPDDPAGAGLVQKSGYLLAATDLLLIGLELTVIFLFVMFAHLTIGSVKYAVAFILPGGGLAFAFWVWVVLVGLVIPGLVELFCVAPRLLYQREYRPTRLIEILLSISVLIGAFMLRYVVVVAGQATGPVGL